ncbi:hypothetical protein [Thalassovita sp.]|uniref:hypothetical protein n=1 Tax=Thalassovita sp. TaxID=1979401 RepID=UPI002AB24A0C|nr:hypothetical protein [Thalassovita sp.]
MPRLDFANAPKLPAGIGARMQAVADKRIAEGCQTKSGSIMRTPEQAQFMDDLAAWKAAGRSEAGLVQLKAREAALKAAGLW